MSKKSIKGKSSRDRIINLLERYPQGLSVEEITKILGYTRNTVYQRLHELLYYRKVIEIRTSSQRLFRLAKFDIITNDKAYEKKVESK